MENRNLSRQRVEAALNHQQPDQVPVDFGGSAVTGISVSSVYLLRQALQLDPPGTPVKVVEPFQMLGEIAPDLQDALGVDVVGVGGQTNFFGFRNEDWKPWQTFDGTPVLVPGLFNTDPEPNGDILQYPQGNKTVPPSGRMPKGGFYFDAIVRQPEIDENRLDPNDNLEEFIYVNENDLAYFEKAVDDAYATGKAVLASFGGTSFGDIALVPATQLKHPKGIRDIAEWYMSTVSRTDYVWQVFEQQCEIGLENLQRIHEVVGEKVTAVFITGTDFGTQTGPFISPRSYRKLYQPFHRQLNDWVHANTNWKTFIHSCGSIYRLLPDIVDAGFDILNPVQTSAVDMDASRLKAEFGDRVTFWGGGIDTQKTLPFGSPVEIRQQVKARMELLGKDGGFVFNAIHNIQASTLRENLAALVEAIREYR